MIVLQQILGLCDFFWPPYTQHAPWLRESIRTWTKLRRSAPCEDLRRKSWRAAVPTKMHHPFVTCQCGIRIMAVQTAISPTNCGIERDILWIWPTSYGMWFGLKICCIPFKIWMTTSCNVENDDSPSNLRVYPTLRQTLDHGIMAGSLHELSRENTWNQRCMQWIWISNFSYRGICPKGTKHCFKKKTFKYTQNIG